MAVESLSSEIISAYHNACPLQEKGRKKKYVFTGEIRDRVKEKRRLRQEKNTAAANHDWTSVREKMTQINRLGNEIKKIQKRQKRVKLEEHCKSLNSEKNPKKFFQTFKLLSDPIGASEPDYCPFLDNLQTAKQQRRADFLLTQS